MIPSGNYRDPVGICGTRAGFLYRDSLPHHHLSGQRPLPRTPTPVCKSLRWNFCFSFPLLLLGSLVGGSDDPSDPDLDLTGTDEADSRPRGVGEDVIFTNTGELVTGSAGFDEIVVLDSASTGAVLVLDYVAGADVYTVLFDMADDSIDPPPGVFEVRASGDDALILRNGEDYLRLIGVAPADVDLSDFTVQP